MATIYCDVINEEMLEVARMLSNVQHEEVRIITPTECVEVHYEEAEESQQEHLQRLKTW